MTVTINVNNLSMAHQGSGGLAVASLPNVCLTPSPAGPMPVPYPNIARTASLEDGSVTVLADGGNSIALRGSRLATSNGDEAGTGGGVVSGKNGGAARWLTWSSDVKIEGRNVARLTDKLICNDGNTACLAGLLQDVLDQMGRLASVLTGVPNLELYRTFLCLTICRCASTAVPKPPRVATPAPAAPAPAAPAPATRPVNRMQACVDKVLDHIDKDLLQGQSPIKAEVTYYHNESVDPAIPLGESNPSLGLTPGWQPVGISPLNSPAGSGLRPLPTTQFWADSRLGLDPARDKRDYPGPNETLSGIRIHRPEWSNSQNAFAPFVAGRANNLHRLDAVILRDRTQPPWIGNVLALVEIKFDLTTGDRLRRTQPARYEAIAKSLGTEYFVLSETNCGCRRPRRSGSSPTESLQEIEDIFSDMFDAASDNPVVNAWSSLVDDAIDAMMQPHGSVHGAQLEAHGLASAASSDHIPVIPVFVGVAIVLLTVALLPVKVLPIEMSGPIQRPPLEPVVEPTVEPTLEPGPYMRPGSAPTDTHAPMSGPMEGVDPVDKSKEG